MRHQVQQTSLFAFNQVRPHLGAKQAAVYRIIVTNPGIDNLGIAEKLHMPINSITPRVKELREMKRVKECGKHHSNVTGRLVMGWEAI